MDSGSIPREGGCACVVDALKGVRVSAVHATVLGDDVHTFVSDSPALVLLPPNCRRRTRALLLHSRPRLGVLVPKQPALLIGEPVLINVLSVSRTSTPAKGQTVH